jgi:hypothetical protein
VGGGLVRLSFDAVVLMDWQDYTVWGLVAVIGLLLLRWLACLLSGRRSGGCASCGETRCPLKNRKKK